MENLVYYIVEKFENGNLKELIAFLISILPIIEAKGGLLAASLMNIPVQVAVPICFLGNILPIPFLILFLKKIMSWMEKYKIFSKFLKTLKQKVEKRRGKIEKYGYWALWLFVANPIPGTGAYTGALIATCLNMNIKKSAITIILGTICSVLIMTGIYYGIF